MDPTKARSWQGSTAPPMVVIRYVHHHPMGSTKHQDTRCRWLPRRISRCHNPRNLGEVFVFPLFSFFGDDDGLELLEVPNFSVVVWVSISS